MKGREIINYAVRDKMPDRERIRESCKGQGAVEKRRGNKRLFARFAVSAAVLAVLVASFIFGNMLLNPAGDNMFAIKAYAMEQQEDGSIELREVDLLDRTQRWGSYNDGSNFYLNISMKCEGENIRSVDFYAEDGFFAKQYLKMKDGKIVVEDGVTACWISDGAGGHTLAMYGTDFEIIGSELTLENGVMTDDSLLFLATEITDWQKVPAQMTISAVVTFNDGKTQEEILAIDIFSQMGVGIIKLPPEEMSKRQEEFQKREEILRGIPLDQCQIVPDSVKTLTYGETYEYSIRESGGIGYFPITKEAMDSAEEEGMFDENGIFRIGSSLPENGSDGYIAAIEKNGDGMFTGRVYKVPGPLLQVISPKARVHPIIDEIQSRNS